MAFPTVNERFTIKFTNLMRRWNTRGVDINTTTGIQITVNGVKYKIVKVP
jgi:hypothetical protein